MNWEPVSDNGTHVTIRLKMQNGWSANHAHFRSQSDYDTASGSSWGNGVWVDGYIGSIKVDYYETVWGDGTTNTAMDHKILSRDNLTRGGSGDCDKNNNFNNLCVNSVVLELGEYASSTWTSGLTHTYPINGTTEYIVYWTSQDRAEVENDNGKKWRNQTKVNIGGTYRGNSSPVSSVPPVVQVQDNKTFKYQLVATDTDGDTLNFRWGKTNEFFTSDGSGSTDNFTMPTGMTLSSSGLVTWDVTDNTLNTNEGDLWVSVIMVEDLADNGSVKSYIPIDFFFKIASASNDPPSIFGIPNDTQTVTVGVKKTFTITSTDDSGVAPTISVLNPPSDNSSIWETTTSSSGGETTFSMSFTPVSSMDNVTYPISIVSTDNEDMTKDQTLALKVSSISNTDPTEPTLISPIDNATVTNPVTFQWTKSTDPDNDDVSHKIYICTNTSFAGCSGTSVTAGIYKFNPPLNQKFDYFQPFSWPNTLQAETISQHISKYNSMIPEFFVFLSIIASLIGVIFLSMKNFRNRRIVLMLLFIIIGLATCARSFDSDKKSKTTTKTKDSSYTPSDNLTTGTTYYWKVSASDPKGGLADSDTGIFNVQ